MISAAMVKDLREKTGAGMMDCKKALTETNGDFEVAVDWLRKKGLSAAAKKAGRTAADGVVAIAVDNLSAAIIELNSETDFVARNDKFQSFAQDVAKLAIVAKDLDTLKVAKVPSGKTVDEELIENIAVIGENLNLRRIGFLSVDKGAVATYVHNQIVANIGKIGVVLALESVGDKAELEKVGRQIAMHVAAARPQFLTIADVDSKTLERERDIFVDQAKASGKPEAVIEKMVEGRVRKFYEESVLLEQIFVIDGKTKISIVLEELSAKLGAKVTLRGFVRFEVGEGIEVEHTNFADEVNSVVNNR